MATDFLDKLNKEVLVCFGAIGTMLAARYGFDPSTCQELFTSTHPDAYQHLINSYLEAGCEVLPCAIASSNRIRMEAFGLADRAAEITRKVSQLSRQFVPEDRYLCGILNMTGRFIEPLGDVTYAQLYEAFTEEVIISVEEGVDLMWVQTFADIQETTAAIRACKENCNLSVVAAMSFSRTPQGHRTMMGVDPKMAARAMVEAGADVIGTNCGGEMSWEDAAEVLAEMRQVTNKPLWAKPNAGIPQINKDGTITYSVAPQRFAQEAPLWVEQGARIVGGCCGSGPGHAREINAILKAKGLKSKAA